MHCAYKRTVMRAVLVAAHGYNGQRLHKIMYCCKQKSVHTHLCPMQPVDLLQGPFQNVAADVVGPFKAAMYDCHYAIILLDYYSKWPEVPFASFITTGTLLPLITTVFAREGNPEYIATDNFAHYYFLGFLERH